MRVYVVIYAYTQSFVSFMKISENLLVIVLLFVFALFLRFSDVGCIIRYFFGIPCPTCGMTRALLSLLKLELRAYFYYNAFALPVFFSVIAIIFCKCIHKCFLYLAIFILTLNIAYYIYRLSCHAIP